VAKDFKWRKILSEKMHEVKKCEKCSGPCRSATVVARHEGKARDRVRGASDSRGAGRGEVGALRGRARLA
jgi:hypothetical protein